MANSGGWVAGCVELRTTICVQPTIKGVPSSAMFDGIFKRGCSAGREGLNERGPFRCGF